MPLRLSYDTLRPEDRQNFMLKSLRLRIYATSHPSRDSYI
jgi:hypothetical protein